MQKILILLKRQISVECINITTKSEHILKSCRLTKLLMMQEKGIEYYLKNLVFNTKVRYDVHKQLSQTEDVSED